MYKTRKLSNGKYSIERPSTYRQEYHGNGKNAWYNTTEEINGHKIEYVSIRYSYRWHKTAVYLDNERLLTAADYARADRLINGD